jgi:hypothetical protein
VIRRLLAWLYDRWDDAWPIDGHRAGDVEAEWARLWNDDGRRDA